MSVPTLSVTVLSYNYGHYLASCLEGILGQTFRDIEVIVIDDCSTDDTPQVVEPFTRDPRVRSVRHAVNRGYRDSLIEGTEELSRGEFVTVISADDVVRRPDAFELQFAAIRSRPDTSMCFSAVDRFDSDSDRILAVEHSYDGDRMLEPMQALRAFLAEDAWAMHSGTIVRASAYRAAGGYARDIRFSLDTQLWPVVAQEGPVAYVDHVLYGYRTHAAQMSRSLQTSRETPLELVKLIERACARAQARGWDIGGLQNEAIRYRIGTMLMQDAFSGSPKNVLLAAWESVKLRPATLLTTRLFWIALARAIAGQRAYGAVQAAARRVRLAR